MSQSRRTFLRAACALPLVLGGLGLAGCETTVFQGNPENQSPERVDWQETEPIPVASFDHLWMRTRATLENDGYRIDDRLTSFGRREMVTHWVTSLSTARFEGVRRRVHLEFEPTGPADSGPWVVRCAVLRQRNADIDSPTNPTQANWERHGAEPNRTALILYKVRAGLVEETEEK